MMSMPVLVPNPCALVMSGAQQARGPQGARHWHIANPGCMWCQTGSPWLDSGTCANHPKRGQREKGSSDSFACPLCKRAAWSNAQSNSVSLQRIPALHHRFWTHRPIAATLRRVELGSVVKRLRCCFEHYSYCCLLDLKSALNITSVLYIAAFWTSSPLMIAVITVPRIPNRCKTPITVALRSKRRQ